MEEHQNPVSSDHSVTPEEPVNITEPAPETVDADGSGGDSGKPPGPPVYKKWWFWLAAAAVVGVVIAAVRGLSPDVKVTPTLAEGDRVSALTAFSIETKGTYEIQMDPRFEFTRELREGGADLLVPLRPLDAGSSLTVTVVKGEKEYSFPFRVSDDLLVTSHFPVDGGRSVPVRTGVEIAVNSGEIPLNEFKGAFSIEPAVSGSFTYESGRFIFYTDEPMAYDTEYVVTLSDLGSGDVKLAEPYTFSFHTASEEEETYLYMYNLKGTAFSSNSLKTEPPIVQIYLDETLAAQENLISVDLHLFPDAEAYKASMVKTLNSSREIDWLQTRIDTQELTPFTSFEVSPLPAQSSDDNKYYSGDWIVPFPEALPEGWYVASLTLDIDGTPVTRQLYLQVSDISVFYMTLEDQLLAWVNDAETGQPLSGAEITLEGAYRGGGTVGEDGIAMSDDLGAPPADRPSHYTLCTIRKDGRTYVDASLQYFYGATQDEIDAASKRRDYLTYLFTDRTIYKTTDTIKIWGVIRPRNDGVQLPAELTLSLDDGLAQVPVSPGPNGIFTAEMELENLSAGYWMSLELMDGDVSLRSSSLEITDYVKPIYTADTSPGKPVYLIGAEDPELSTALNVRTFDGAPAAGFDVRFEIWDDTVASAIPDGSSRQTTDASGNVSTPLTLLESQDSWYPGSYWYEYASDSALSENFSVTGQVTIIHRDLMLRGMPAYTSPGKASLEITTHRVDISGLETADDLFPVENIQGEALSEDITVDVFKIWYEKVKTGSHYDFVSRTTVDTFDYNRKEDLVDTYQVTTKDGSYTLEDLPRSGDDVCYYALLQGTDSLGRDTRATVWLGPEIYRYGGQADGSHRYELVKESDALTLQSEGESGVFFQNDTASFQDGEDVTFVLHDNDEPMESITGSLLTTVMQDGFADVTISDDVSLTLPFEERLVPNYSVSGAYFDGKRIFALENTLMRFDPAKRELELTITTDKAAYSPGDDITVTVEVKNKASGAVAEGADVTLSVVDEAVFALREQNLNLLTELYERIYDSYPNKYVSYPQSGLADAGEKGGGGGGDLRKDFKDTASFQTGTTGADGKATFSFRLPDDITSWRLSSLALTADNHAGGFKETVASTKDFFLLPIVIDTLLTGDDCVIGLGGMGRGVSIGDAAEYAVSIAGDGVDESQEVSAELGGSLYVNFGKLAPGDYTATIEGTCGGHQDAVQLPFTVQDSGLETTRIQSFNLADGVDIDPIRYPVNLSFYGKGGYAWHYLLSSIPGAAQGSRTDMLLARAYVAGIFEKQGHTWLNDDDTEVNLQELGAGYLLQPFSYAMPDVELSVKAHLAMPEKAPANWLEGLSVSDSTEYYTGSRSAIYLAKALAGETLPANLESTLENAPSGMDYVDQLYLVMALARSGKTQEAEAWYETLVTPHLQEADSVSGMAFAYVDRESGDRDPLANTAAASMLATMLGKREDAQALVLYLADKQSPYEAYVLEQVYFLTAFHPEENGASFSYRLDGKEETVTLGTTIQTLSLNKDQLAQADFAVLSGEVYADAFYTAAPSEDDDAQSKTLKLTKTIEAVNGGVPSAGEQVKITLTPDLSGLDGELAHGVLYIDDYLPSGTRYEGYAYGKNEGSQSWYLNRREGQRVRFTVYGLEAGQELQPIVYYARCAAPGDYVVESARIHSSLGPAWGSSDRDQVSIR